jgi:hypothetical protein
MTDDFTASETSAASAAAQTMEGIKHAGQRIGAAIETGLEPGMPLDHLATRVREAPLAALAIAFALGVMIGRRR